MRLKNINPDAYAALDEMRNGMRQEKVNRQLAARALPETAHRHSVGTAQARQSHKRRPRVELV